MKWAEGKVKKLTVFDFGIVKLYCALIGIVIGAYIANFVKAAVWYFLAIIVLMLIYLLVRITKK